MNPAFVVGTTITGLGLFFILLGYFFSWWDRRKDIAGDLFYGLSVFVGFCLAVAGVAVNIVSAVVLRMIS